MKEEEGEIMSREIFVNMLDDAMYAGTKLIITTKERGKIIGVPHSVDHFDTDDDRWGYVIEIGEHLVDTAYIDEITEIVTSPVPKPEGFIQVTAKLVSGE